ncbi:MAG TPA: hypothetical protein VFI28_07580 [Candidatus Limnocylindrales bacterium]|nr:hypothetical protein [Candidatus Limnocylindrales bacterium]
MALGNEAERHWRLDRHRRILSLPVFPVIEKRRVVMDLGISLGFGGWIVLVAGALVLGVIAQLIGETETNYEWIVAAVAAFLGALVASEFIVAWRGFEPVYDGLALVPALAGGLVVGIAADLVTRFGTGGSYTAAHGAA